MANTLNAGADIGTIAAGVNLLVPISIASRIVLNFVGVNPVQALFWVSVINGFLSPPLVVIILLIANNREVMGERVNGPGSRQREPSPAR